jgi:hypothetical protein
MIRFQTFYLHDGYSATMRGIPSLDVAMSIASDRYRQDPKSLVTIGDTEFWDDPRRVIVEFSPPDPDPDLWIRSVRLVVLFDERTVATIGVEQRCDCCRQVVREQD